MPIAVIRLTPSDAERFARFREEMLTDSPWAFASTLEDDDSLDLVHMRRVLGERENAIIAVEAAETLVATAGILRMNSSKFSHRAKLWGVFVTPDHRGRGLGRAVTTAAIELARGWEGVEFVDLGVSSNAPEAHRLYASLGFEEWGREPETTKYNERRYDEIYMALRISRNASAYPI